MPRPLTTALRPQMIASLLCALLFSGCLKAEVHYTSDPYWQVEREIPVKASAAGPRLQTMTPKGFALAEQQTDWAALSVDEDGDLALAFPERKVCVVTVESTQYADAEHRNGWKAHTALWGYLAGVPLAVAGAIELGLSTTAPPSALVADNANVTANFTEEEKLLSGGVLTAIGGALVAAATTAISLQHLDTQVPGDTRSVDMLQDSCTEDTELPLVPRTLRGEVTLDPDSDQGAQSVKLAIDKGRVSVTQDPTTPYDIQTTWLLDALSKPITVSFDTSVRVGLPGNPFAETHAALSAPQRVLLPAGDVSLRSALIRAVATHGVTVNTPTSATFSQDESGQFTLHLEAFARITSAESEEGEHLATTLGERVQRRDKHLIAKRPRWPVALTIPRGPSRADTKSADANQAHQGLSQLTPARPILMQVAPFTAVDEDGTSRISWPIDTRSTAWALTLTLSDWLKGEDVVLEVPGTTLRWALPPGERETIGAALLASLSQTVKETALPSLDTRSSPLDPERRMAGELPMAELIMQHACAATLKGKLATACAGLKTAWRTKLLAYRKALAGELSRTIAEELRDSVRDFDPSSVDEDTVPKEHAEYYCGDMDLHAENVCGKDAPLPHGGACAVAKSCLWKVLPKVQAAVAKVKAEIAREEARERAEEARARAEEAREEARARAEEARERAEELRTLKAEMVGKWRADVGGAVMQFRFDKHGSARMDLFAGSDQRYTKGSWKVQVDKGGDYVVKFSSPAWTGTFRIGRGVLWKRPDRGHHGELPFYRQ